MTKARKFAPVSSASFSQRTGQDHAKKKRVSLRERRRIEKAKSEIDKFHDFMKEQKL